MSDPERMPQTLRGRAEYIRELEAERDTYREVLAVIASGDWVEDNPLVMRDFAREALKAEKR